MSEANSNEKKNNTEREHREGGNGGQNRRNHKNNYRRYHQKRPYPRNNENAAGTPENNAAQNAGDVKPENAQRSPKNLNEGGREPRKNPRHNGIDKRKSQIRVEETIQDIDIDIGRIEKEIELEIKEIAAFKFGL